MAEQRNFADRDGWIWMDGALRPWREANVHILTHAMHYASSVFEGQRAYNGTIFKLSEHSQRLRNSASLLGFELPWSVEEIELDPPKAGEVLVQLKASGMCHSDEHVVTGDLAGAAPGPPMIGGHEGAGVVVEVGEGVSWLEPGDHVVFGFVPACGRCVMCVTGHSNLCDNAAAFPTGLQIGDGVAALRRRDVTDPARGNIVGLDRRRDVVG